MCGRCWHAPWHLLNLKWPQGRRLRGIELPDSLWKPGMSPAPCTMAVGAGHCTVSNPHFTTACNSRNFILQALLCVYSIAAWLSQRHKHHGHSWHSATPAAAAGGVPFTYGLPSAFPSSALPDHCLQNEFMQTATGLLYVERSLFLHGKALNTGCTSSLCGFMAWSQAH